MKRAEQQEMFVAAGEQAPGKGRCELLDRDLERLTEKLGEFAKGRRKAMASDDERSMGAVVDALQGLSDRLDKVLNGNGKRGRQRDRDEDAPESASHMSRRGKDAGEIQGVLFPVSIPLGRGGDTLSCYLLTGAVRDERDLLDLADEIDRGEFRRVLRVYRPKQEYNSNRGNSNYNNGGGGYNGGYNRDRGGYDRDRDYRR